MDMSGFGRLRQQGLADSMDVEPSPELLEVVERAAELWRGQSFSLVHSSQGCRRLDVGNRGGSHPVCVVVGELRCLGARLVDQQLDKGAGIEVEAQRRPSAT